MSKKINKDKDNIIIRSVNKNVRSSTRKLKPILRSIVGKKVDIAIRDLNFSDKRISKDVQKTISSAIANAENNFQYNIDNLIIKEAYCGKQIIMKRFRARAKGRASPIMKPYSNLTIILTEKEKEKVNMEKR
jgi:large subunit ribosomal protein L22